MRTLILALSLIAAPAFADDYDIALGQTKVVTIPEAGWFSDTFTFVYPMSEELYGQAGRFEVVAINDAAGNSSVAFDELNDYYNPTNLITGPANIWIPLSPWDSPYPYFCYMHPGHQLLGLGGGIGFWLTKISRFGNGDGVYTLTVSGTALIPLSKYWVNVRTLRSDQCRDDVAPTGEVAGVVTPKPRRRR